MVSVGATEQKRILVAKGEGCEDAPRSLNPYNAIVFG